MQHSSFGFKLVDQIKMTTVIKIGSNVVADRSGAVRKERLREVCEQAAVLRRQKEGVVLVTSGAIALGMHMMELDQRPREMDELQAASAVGQGALYQIYNELLRASGVDSAQVLLTFFDMSARTHYLNARSTLAKLLQWRRVPVINENDTTATDEISFGDNDFLAAQVAILVGADRLLLLTDTDGLHSADPEISRDAKLIEQVDDFSLLDDYEIGVSATPVGAGGMRSKVVAAEMATAAGIETLICNGMKEGVLEAALDGEKVGTRFLPQQDRYSSFKLWLKYAKASHGRLVIDSGAERALRQQGKSLLPVGIVRVEGNFHAGDAVELVTDGDQAVIVGKGICNYSSDELGRIAGLSSDQIHKLTRRAAEEAVHRDYLVIV